MTMSRAMEGDAGLYWRISTDTAERRRQGLLDPDYVVDTLDELDTNARMTEWPRLRARIKADCRALEAEMQAALGEATA